MPPLPSLDDTIQAKVSQEVVRSLVQEWFESMGPSSNPADFIANPAFRRIVGLGRDAVPLILDEIRRQPSLLILALHEITGENPIPKGARGRLADMANAWIGWGKINGMI